jgi:hypothetical protein
MVNHDYGRSRLCLASEGTKENSGKMIFELVKSDRCDIK